MGAAASKCCESSAPVEVKTLEAGIGEYPPMDKGMYEGDEGSGSTIDKLQGPWLDKSKDFIPICNIQESQIHWHESGVSEFKFAGGQLSVDIDDAPFTAILKPGSPPHLAWSDGCLWVRDELQGQWKKDGEELLGSVRDGMMYWDSKFEHPPSKLEPIPVMPFGLVAMRLEDTTCRGIFDPGPPARLTWDDGEVWIRSAVF